MYMLHVPEASQLAHYMWGLVEESRTVNTIHNLLVFF